MAENVNSARKFQKKFKERESVLSQMIDQTKHIRTLYNIILGTLYVYFASIIVEYATNSSLFRKDLELVRWNLCQFFPHFLIVWTVMKVDIVVLYYGLACSRWSLQSKKLAKAWGDKKTPPNSPEWAHKKCRLGRGWSYLFLIVHLTNLIVLGAFVSWYIFHYNLTISVGFGITMELVRFMMKSHSYFIEKRLENELVEKQTEILSEIKKNRLSRPSLGAFMYYLFAPTLIYRDEYPRNPHSIRWRVVVLNLVQFVGGIIIVFLLIDRFVIATFSRVGLEPFSPRGVALGFRNMFMYGVMLSLVTFYCFLHLYHNATAEILGFSDRQFYREWWQSMNMSDYYRKWNCIVQDWLFTYVYLPIRYSTGSNNFTSFIVILLSGIAHEYILGMALGFCFPALFVCFVLIGHIIFTLTKNVHPQNLHNVLSVSSVFFGWGLISSMYALEYYSRRNCPIQNPRVIDYFIPQVFSCIKFKWT